MSEGHPFFEKKPKGHVFIMDPEVLQEILANSPWMPCMFCRETMPFEIIEIPNLGQGAVCMNCGTPSTDTQAALEQQEQMEIMNEEAKKIYSETGMEPEEVMDLLAQGYSPEEITEMQMQRMQSSENLGSENMEEMDEESDEMYNAVKNMTPEEFEEWQQSQYQQANDVSREGQGTYRES